MSANALATSANSPVHLPPATVPAIAIATSRSRTGIRPSARIITTSRIDETVTVTVTIEPIDTCCRLRP